VLPALQPELYSFTQGSLPSGETYPQGAVEIILYGTNLIEGMEVYLQPAETGAEAIPPLASFPAGENTRLIFNRGTLGPGRYTLHVVNPGGLETSLEITISPAPLIAADTPAEVPLPAGGGSGAEDTSAEPLSPGVGPDDAPAEPSAPAGGAGVPDRVFAIYVSTEYTPLIPLYGYLFDTLDQVFHPWGASIRIGFIPISRLWGSLGLELVPSWNLLKAGTVTINMEPLHLNGVYYARLPGQRAALVFRLGAGVNLIFGTNSGGQNDTSIFTWVSSVNGGIAFRWFIRNLPPSQETGAGAFYFEIGTEYTHLFLNDSPGGYVKPALEAGWSF
jgi:hypothetical protein